MLNTWTLQGNKRKDLTLKLTNKVLYNKGPNLNNFSVKTGVKLLLII